MLEGVGECKLNMVHHRLLYILYGGHKGVPELIQGRGEDGLEASVGEEAANRVVIAPANMRIFTFCTAARCMIVGMNQLP
jgi:hypothetical protein